MDQVTPNDLLMNAACDMIGDRARRYDFEAMDKSGNRHPFSVASAKATQDVFSIAAKEAAIVLGDDLVGISLVSK